RLQAVHAVARIVECLVVTRLPPAAAEGDLVRAAHPVAIDQRAVVGAFGLVEVVRPVPDATWITIGRRLQATLRIEPEPIADVAGAPGDEHVVAGDEVDLALEER